VLEWPFENRLHKGISIVNYIDNSSTPGVVDYMCLPHAYDTHTGTDMGIYHFRAMDEGRAVIAAAGGQSSMLNMQTRTGMLVLAAGQPMLSSYFTVILR
jgi:hypothetical protein